MMKFFITMLFMSLISLLVCLVFALLDASEIVEWSDLVVCSPLLAAVGFMVIGIIPMFISYMRDR